MKPKATPWYKYCRYSIRIPIVNIWRLWDGLIFVMGIPLLTIPHIHIETAHIVSCESNCLRESFHQSHTIYLFLNHWYMVLVSMQFIIFFLSYSYNPNRITTMPGNEKWTFVVIFRFPRNEKQTYRLNSRPQMWPSVWPWSWPWPWIFTVKYGICYMSAKIYPIATKRKSNISTELMASNVTIRFDIGNDLDLEFRRSNREFTTSQPKMVRLPTNDRKIYRLNSRLQMWPMGLTLTTILTK